nr:immunoglobulin heavy chain junction region [Mus musculus]
CARTYSNYGGYFDYW